MSHALVAARVPLRLLQRCELVAAAKTAVAKDSAPLETPKQKATA